ncbi:hypothetical protein MNBD_GAMMA07-149 [hydrothermal vent metagenome]|uniref:CBS domain-containing protein n=1 Tax=hydrothermal vent metagenome TaxID=652676 RepID=A0A3B0X1R5_9ZZZZ
MKTIGHVMVTGVVNLIKTDDVHHARMLMKEKNIRHIPVLSEKNGTLLGVITQHSLLNNAFNVVEKYGLGKLEKKERQTHVSQIMRTDCETVASDTDIELVCEAFLKKKYSYLLIVDDEKLVGIVTSVDFVKLSLHLLQNT